MLHHADDLIFVDHFVANEVSRESRILDRLSKTRKCKVYSQERKVSSIKEHSSSLVIGMQITFQVLCKCEGAGLTNRTENRRTKPKMVDS